jgi:hypothetical protein
MNITASNSFYQPLSIDGLNSADLSNLFIEGVEIKFADFFNKTSDDSDDIKEGILNRFDHITCTAPLVRTVDVISMPVSTTSANGYLSSYDWNRFDTISGLWTVAAPNWVNSHPTRYVNFNQGIYMNSSLLCDLSKNISCATVTATSTINCPQYYVNGYNIVDSSRNMTNINTLTVAGAITSTSGNITSGNYVIAANISASNSYICNGTQFMDSGRNMTNIGTLTLSGHISGVTSWFSSYVNSAQYLINGTQVIDGSRNLTNIGTIGCGAITSSGIIMNTSSYIDTGDVRISGNYLAEPNRNVHANNIRCVNNDFKMTNTSGYEMFYMPNTACKDIFLGNNETNGTYNNGNYNLAIGRNCLTDYRNSGYTSSGNTCVGMNCMQSSSNASTNYNTAMGYQCMTNTQSSYNCCCFGYHAGWNSNGSYNMVNLGSWSGYASSSSNNCINLGEQCGYNNSSSSKNINIGNYCGYNSNSSTENVSIGYQTQYNSGGAYKTAVGSHALQNSGTSQYQTALGYSALYSANSSSYLNIGIGAHAGYQISTGYNNIAMGEYAQYSNQTGYHNITIGNASLRQGSAPYENIAIGINALYNTTATGNVVTGHQSGYNITSGINNTLMGNSAGNQITNSNYDCAFGFYALGGSNGGENCGFGYAAGYSNPKLGGANIYMGYRSGYNHLGANSVYLGYDCGLGAGISYNDICIGHNCGNQATGYDRVLIGVSASGTGAFNIGIGNGGIQCSSNYSICIGTGNIANAYMAHSIGSYGTCTGSYAVQYGSYGGAAGYQGASLGYSAKANSDYSTALGPSATSAGDPQNYGVYLNVNVPAIAGTWLYLGFNTNGRVGPVTSSGKYKTNITALNTEIDSLDVIKKLKPVVYEDKDDVKQKKEKKHNKKIHRHIGLIAEDVELVLPNIVPKNDKNECMTVHYDRLVPILIDCIQKLEKRILQLEYRNGIQ